MNINMKKIIKVNIRPTKVEYPTYRKSYHNANSTLHSKASFHTIFQIFNFQIITAGRGNAGNRNQNVFAAANYVTKSDWGTALHQNVFLELLSFLIAPIRRKIKYFHCFWILTCIKSIPFYLHENFKFFTSTQS